MNELHGVNEMNEARWGPWSVCVSVGPSKLSLKSFIFLIHLAKEDTLVVFTGGGCCLDEGADGFDAEVGEGVEGGLCVVGVDDEDEADATIEGPEHLVVGEAFVAFPLGRRRVGLEPAEEGGKGFDGSFRELGVEALREDAGEILEDAAAGDVGGGEDVDVRVAQPAKGLRVEGRRRQEDVREASAGGVLEEGRRVGAEGVGEGRLDDVFLEDFPDEGEAVRVDPRRRQGEQDVPRAHLLGKEVVPSDGADAEAGDVVVGPCVEPGHLGGFASGEGAARVEAALGDALDDARAPVDVELPRRVVVQEIERRRPRRRDVVRAHGHEVDADADGVLVVAEGPRRLGGQLQLRPDAVRPGHQEHVVAAEPRRRQVEHGAEAPDRVHGPGHLRRRRQGFDTLHEGVPRHYVHARRTVRQRPFFRRRRSLGRRSRRLGLGLGSKRRRRSPQAAAPPLLADEVRARDEAFAGVSVGEAADGGDEGGALHGLDAGLEGLRGVDVDGARRLADDGAAVDVFGDEVDGAARLGLAVPEDGLVDGEVHAPGVVREQARVDVEAAAAPIVDERW
mmetsp:Transcript_27424/g.88560  ORF Transcript_27424/g.88560 Transcript_27424/m.88560 type:complete len:563 (+) Transcript_27424:18-1706(+)